MRVLPSQSNGQQHPWELCRYTHPLFLFTPKPASKSTACKAQRWRVSHCRVDASRNQHLAALQQRCACTVAGGVQGAGGRPSAGRWVVELGAGGDRNNAGIADIDDAASHQNQAIRQQCRGLSQAGRRHAAGDRPSAGTRVVQLGAAEKARCAFASRNQHLAVREQRCALRTGKPLCRFLRYYKSIKFRRSVCHQTLNRLSRNVHIDGGVLEFWGTTTSIDRHEFTEVTKVSMWLSLPCHFLEDKQAVEKANCNRHGERQLGGCKPRLSKPVEFLNLRPKAACCRTLSETD